MYRDWNSIMFSDIGKKLQNVAKALAWINIVFSFIGGIIIFFCAFIDFEYLWYLMFLAPVAILVGCIMAWLSAIILYGFGKLVEDVHAIREKEGTTIEKSKRKAEESERHKAEEKAKREAEERAIWQEENKSQKNSFSYDDFIDISCPNCGKMLSFLRSENDGICPDCETKFKIKQL